MERMIKDVIRLIPNLVLKIFFPRLYFIEKKQVDVTCLAKNISNSTISKIAKISTPAQIGNSVISDYTYISRNSMISLTTIGKFCSIGTNFISGMGIHPTDGLSTSPAFYSTRNQAGITFSETNKIEERKEINIGNDVFIGMNVTVLDGVTIGDGAIIGAGSVVSKNIPPYAIAVGCPIQVIKYRFSQNEIEKLLKIKWWDFNDKNLKEVEKYFYNIDEFIKKYTNY